MSLISIQIKDIPDYLKTSDFYNNLDVNEYKYKYKNINVNPIMNYIDENYNYNEVIKKEQELRKQLNSNIGYDDFDY